MQEAGRDLAAHEPRPSRSGSGVEGTLPALTDAQDRRLRKVLIISPRFVPLNAADMHRVRQSLPYLHEFGWHAVVLSVDPRHYEGPSDPLLELTIPPDAEVHRVSAFDARWTRKVGLGSLALRSLWFYKRAGNQLLARGDVDLVYFSTTEFPVAVLGPYWKRRFQVPYIIDMQDPWHTEYYQHRPKNERPRKHWFSYRLNKYLEPIAMKTADAVISVSDEYCDALRLRYANFDRAICEVIPFGGAELDFGLLDEVSAGNPVFKPGDGLLHVVYVGRGGHDMGVAAHALFGALADGLRLRPDLFENVRVHLIGTHYSRSDAAAKTLEPIAELYGLGERVREYPERVRYFTALQLLREADMLLLPGSTSPGYTASKLYPYILSRRPLLAVFSERSSVIRILRETHAGEFVTFAPGTSLGDIRLRETVRTCWTGILEGLPFTPATDWGAFEPYTARAMAGRQAEVFDRVAKGAERIRSARTKWKGSA